MRKEEYARRLRPSKFETPKKRVLRDFLMTRVRFSPPPRERPKKNKSTASRVGHGFGWAIGLETA